MKDSLSNIINDSIDNSVATRNESRDTISGGNYSLLFSLANQNSYVPAWWSRNRDIYLRKFWKTVDYLAGTIYTLEAKLTSIPFKILPRDYSNKTHVKQAQELTELLSVTAQYGNGWSNFYQMFIEDLLTTDNGAFAEVIGEGDPDGPIIGRPITVAHLDSSRCTRTGNKEYPVIYTDDNGTQYKLHYTRVMFISSMSSPIKEMNGVGFCAVSRCINVAQSLLDILTYKMEKLGSRPHRGMMVTRGGLDPEDIRNAFAIADNTMTNYGLSRFSKTVVVGDASLIEADVKLIDLAGLPDGFDEEISTELGISAIALAFGIDMREIWHAQRGITRADAIVQHMKQRGKGPGQLLADTERLFNSKYLPPHLYLSFDYQDDSQDRQVAETKNIRAMKRERDLASKSVDIHTVREIMEDDGDISTEQKIRMELQDGRLADGTSIMNVFYYDNMIYKDVLDLGFDDPLNVPKSDYELLRTRLAEKTKQVRSLIVNSYEGSRKNDYVIAFYALMNLAKHYNMNDLFPELKDEQMYPDGSTADWNDNRVRRVDLTTPTSADLNPPLDSLQPSYDDSENSVQ